MNCKQDDLARVIGQECANSIPIDSIVRCLTLERTTYWLDGGLSGVAATNVWHVEWRGQTHGSVGRYGVRDCNLRPLGNPGEHEVDEMVKRLGVPRDLTQALIGQGTEA